MHHENDNGKRDEGRNDRDPEYCCEIVGKCFHEYDRGKRTEHRTDGVERLSQTEGVTSQIGRREIGNERVAWRTADTLADPVDEARGGKPGNARSQLKHGLSEGCQAIAKRSQ